METITIDRTHRYKYVTISLVGRPAIPLGGYKAADLAVLGIEPGWTHYGTYRSLPYAAQLFLKKPIPAADMAKHLADHPWLR